MIGWGILGAGNISHSVASDLSLTRGSRLVAVGARDLDRAQAFADKHGAERAHGSYAELVADPHVDVVYIGTTHESHADQTRLALEAGKAVLCEKPFTVSAAEAEPLVDLARDRGLFLMEAMWTRFIPALRRIVEQVRDGAIGEVKHVAATFGNQVPYDPTSRLFDPARAGGALLDLGVYPLTIARLVLGPPDRVEAAARIDNGADLSTHMLLTHPGGATASLDCSMEMALPAAAHLYGTEGTIVVPHSLPHPESYTIVRNDREPEHVDVPRTGIGYAHEIDEVNACLRAGLTESPTMPLAETLDMMRLLDDVRRQIGLRYPFE